MVSLHPLDDDVEVSVVGRREQRDFGRHERPRRAEEARIPNAAVVVEQR